LGCNREMKKTT